MSSYTQLELCIKNIYMSKNIFMYFNITITKTKQHRENNFN